MMMNAKKEKKPEKKKEDLLQPNINHVRMEEAAAAANTASVRERYRERQRQRQRVFDVCCMMLKFTVYNVGFLVCVGRVHLCL